MHLRALEAEVEPFLRTQNQSIVGKLEADRLHYVYRVGDPPAVPKHWPAIWGDILFNLRSALDHLAYLLVPTDHRDDRTEFPIFWEEGGPKGFTKRARRKMPGVDPAVWRQVEEVQPYKRGEKNHRDPLWLIHELNRIDKHRELVIALAGVDWGRWGPPPGVPIPELSILPSHDYVEDTRIAEFTFLHPLDHDVDLNAKFALDLFTEEAGLSDTPLLRVLRRLLGYVNRNIIERRFAQFF